MPNTQEDIFYCIGKWLLIPVVFVCVIMNIINPETLTALPGCVFLEYVKLPCPGCGGTRAVYYLANGNFLTALYYHPFTVYAAAVYCLFMLVCFLKRCGVVKTRKEIVLEPYIYIGIAILLLQYAVRIAVLLLS